MSDNTPNDALETGPLPEDVLLGVENPEIIDLITLDPRSGEVVLRIVERRPWGSDPKQLAQFDEKLNRYLAYVLDGFLVRHYPQYAGKPVRIEIACVEPPTDERVLRFFEGVEMVCESNDIGLSMRVEG
jgi:hypothetical protein